MTSHLTVFQQHRPRLFSLAYRLLGSAAEAEDMLQDAYLRFELVALEAIDSPPAFLTTIVTRLCLNELTSARARRETYVGPWLPEPVLSEAVPGPESQATTYDSISLAFLALLERLTPAERAVFVLREVFEYDYAEIAAVLEKTPAACRKLFSRAREFVIANRPRFTASPEAHRRLLEAFMQAAGAGDLEGLTHLLAEDCIFWADGGGKVRGAALQPVHGREAVARFVLGVTARFLPPGARFAVADVNGRPTLLIRQADGTPAFVISLEVDANQVSGVWVVANPDKLRAL
jgi:RNA polymerase sigma-70 factor (ECF subfamily)